MIPENWMISMRILIESGKVDDEENHSGKDKASVEDVNISVLH